MDRADEGLHVPRLFEVEVMHVLRHYAHSVSSSGGRSVMREEPGSLRYFSLQRLLHRLEVHVPPLCR